MNDDMIIYEQPLNELIRICLRLEHLFQLIDHHYDKPFVENSRCSLTAILDVLSIVERPDLKTKLVKALALHAERLSHLEKSHNVDQEKLANFLTQLDNLIDILHTQPGRIGQALKENEFLAMVRQRLSIPAGDCNFNLPSYQRWLAQPHQQRLSNLQSWMKSYTQLKDATEFLLKLTRQNAIPSAVHIDEGFHQQTLDANIAWQLIRVATPLHAEIYPEISVGRHRLSIRFHHLPPNGRPSQSKQAIQCMLTLCSG